MKLALSTATIALLCWVAPSAANKKGLAFNDAGATRPFGNTAGWAYNWDSKANGPVGDGQQYIPMLWGTAADHTNQWFGNADAAIAGGASHLLGFNEPDHGQQANLSPDAAAAAWRQYMQPYAGRAKLVSPAVTNGPAPMGLAWLDSFLGACGGCTIDVIAIHIYDAAWNTAYFQNYISGVVSRYGKPVWVTEYGASGSIQEQQMFLQTMIPWFNGQGGVERHAYFADLEGILVSGGQLTALGQTYAQT